jgi:hypothetical protein
MLMLLISGNALNGIFHNQNPPPARFMPGRATPEKHRRNTDDT